MDQAARDLVGLVETLKNLDVPALTIAILILGYRQTWVWGHQLRAMASDRDYWRHQALRATSLAEGSVANRPEPTV